MAKKEKRENWYKWLIITIPALIAVYIVSYALQWVFWKWIWLAIPVWVIFYFIDREYGVSRYQYGFSISRMIKGEDREKWWKRLWQKSRKKSLIV